MKSHSRSLESCPIFNWVIGVDSIEFKQIDYFTKGV